MRNILLIVLNLLKGTFRKKSNIIIYGLLPLLGVLVALLIYGGSDNSVIKVGITNLDTGDIAKDMASIFTLNEKFEVISVIEEEINERLLDSEVDAVVVIPVGYTAAVLEGNIPDIEIVSLKGQGVTAWIEQLINGHSNVLYKFLKASGGEWSSFEKMYYQYKSNQILLETTFLQDKRTDKNMTLTIIGFFVMMMMLGSGFTSTLILKEKRSRTYHRICSAPVNAWQYITANVATSFILTVLQIIFLLLVTQYVFHIDAGTSFLSMFVILLMFGFVAIGIGLTITAFSDSTNMASSLNTLILTPTCMLGGCFWSIDLMPQFMRKISYFMPQRWVIDGLEKLQTGSNLNDIFFNLIVLAAFALTLGLISVYRFSRTDNLQKFI